MGPDEHNAVREATEAFTNPNGAPVLAYDLGDARTAVLLRAVNSRRAMVGTIMVIVDSRVIKQDPRGAARLVTPKLQEALGDFAGMRPGGAPPSSPTPPAPSPISAAPAAARAANTAPVRAPATPAAETPARTLTPPRAAPTAKLSLAEPPPMSATAKTRIAPPAATAPSRATESGLNKRPSQTITPEIDRLHAALRRSPIALHVQRLVPLTKGSQLKRYEVLLRSKSEDAPNAAPQAMLKAAVDNGLGSMIDRRVITELVGWLVHHPTAWHANGAMFSVNLTATALHDEHFIKFIELCLAKSALPTGTLAFEVDVPTAMKLAARMNDVAVALKRLGCPLVLDDFAMRTECFDLLRLPGVRYVKLAPAITSKMRTDKLAQAAITAVVQMARVLGMHTVAKRTESAAEQEWLTALGVDFIQSNAMSPPVAIDSLA